MMRAVGMVRAWNPYIIRYPSDLVQQMGPGTFFYRLGQIGPLALAGYLVTRFTPKGWFSLMRLFGQTSLLVYWVHVELVYGLLFRRLHHRLSITWATVGLVLMTAAMAGLAKLRLRYWHGWPRRKNQVSQNQQGTCPRRSVLYNCGGDGALLTGPRRCVVAALWWPRACSGHVFARPAARRHKHAVARERPVAATRGGLPNVQAQGAVVIDEARAHGVRQERRQGAADRLDLQAGGDAGGGREGGRARGVVDHQQERHGDRQGRGALAAARRDDAVEPRPAPLGADGLGQPRDPRARAGGEADAGAADGGDERQGARRWGSRTRASTSRRVSRPATSRPRARSSPCSRR